MNIESLEKFLKDYSAAPGRSLLLLGVLVIAALVWTFWKSYWSEKGKKRAGELQHTSKSASSEQSEGELRPHFAEPLVAVMKDGVYLNVRVYVNWRIIDACKFIEEVGSVAEGSALLNTAARAAVCRLLEVNTSQEFRQKRVGINSSLQRTLVGRTRHLGMEVVSSEIGEAEPNTAKVPRG